MLLIISKVVVVFIYIGVGFVANKCKVLPLESEKYFTNLLIDITVPCLMISSITGQELNGNMLRNTVLTLILTILVYVIVAVVATFLSYKVFFRNKSHGDKNILASAMTGCNAGFMGVPITKAVFGSQALYYLVIQNITNNLYLFVMIFFHLHFGDKDAAKGKSWRELFKPMINATTVATVAAMVMLFAGVKLPAYFMDILGTIGDVTIPVSMMMVGVKLGGADFKRVFASKDLLITSGFKLIIAPALALLFVAALPVDPLIKLIAVLATSFPTAVIGVAVAAREKLNSQLMAEAVANSTLLSMLTLPVWIMILSRLYL